MKRVCFFYFFPLLNHLETVSGKTKLFMNMGWIYRRVHSRTTPYNSHWNWGGRGKGTVSILTKTFGCWAWGTKAKATKGHNQPQYGDHGSQQPHSAGTQQIHAGISSLPGHRGKKGKWARGKSRQSGSELPSPWAQLSLINAKLEHIPAGIDPRSSPNEGKSFNKAHTGMCHWEKHGLPLFSCCLSINSFPWGSWV